MTGLVPILTIIVVFAVPYLVIYLQGRRLASLESKIDQMNNLLRGKGGEDA